MVNCRHKTYLQKGSVAYLFSAEFFDTILTITDPFSAPWEKIPGAYGKIYEYANEHHILAKSYENRICMEEIYEKNGVTYMDVYVPIDEGSH